MRYNSKNFYRTLNVGFTIDPSPDSKTVAVKWASTPPRLFNAHVYTILMDIIKFIRKQKIVAMQCAHTYLRVG